MLGNLILLVVTIYFVGIWGGLLLASLRRSPQASEACDLAFAYAQSIQERGRLGDHLDPIFDDTGIIAGEKTRNLSRNVLIDLEPTSPRPVS